MIKVNELNKTYDRRTRNSNKVLHDVSFTLPDTGFVCILGESGCGKTSLINAVGGLDLFDSGSIEVDGKKLTRYGSSDMEKIRNSSFAYIFQNYNLLRDHSVMYNIYVGLHSLDLTHREKIARAKEVLRTVGMEDYARRTVSDLSGGQQQRVAIARAMARRPRVIFADEPTGNLDEANTINICSLLRSISKSGLVIMVTHEERIARFFADCIIRLKDGRIDSISNDWQRGSLSVDDTQTLYTKDLNDRQLDSDTASIRVLSGNGANPVNLVVIAHNDRIIIKVDDQRKVTCTAADDTPVLVEDSRPDITLDNIDDGDERLPLPSETAQLRAGSGMNTRMVWREARHLIRKKDARRIASAIFLILLAALSLFTIGDFLTILHLDPHEFQNVDDRILYVNVSRGPESKLPDDPDAVKDLGLFVRDFIDKSGLKYEYLPTAAVSMRPAIQDKVFIQIREMTATLGTVSHLPLRYLDESSLVYGRMPENSNEIVVDRWILDKMMLDEGILQNGISNLTYFLGKQIIYWRTSPYNPTIVGICDSGNPTMYFSDCGMIAISGRSIYVITIDEFAKLHPELAEGVTVGPGECILLGKNAGARWEAMIGNDASSSGLAFRLKLVKYIGEEVNTFAHYVINSGDVAPILDEHLNPISFCIYTEDSAPLIKYINTQMSDEMRGLVTVEVTDAATRSWENARAEAKEKLGSRMIVTVTVLAVSLVMLFVLQRAKIRSHTEMLAVYRMLCIPSRKLRAVFAAETFLYSLFTTLPTLAVTYTAMKVLEQIPEMDYSPYLPWYVVVAVYAVLLLFHLIATLMPISNMLKKTPAALAASYDA